MHNFKKYMEQRLARMATNMPNVVGGPGNFYLTKYIATEKALVFRLSNDVVQVRKKETKMTGYIYTYMHVL